jgi:hypothetical protein
MPMSHPESDGVAEMLEGGIRAVSTGALRTVEMLQRRQQWVARHHAGQLDHSTRQVRQQQGALATIDDLAQTGTQTRRRPAAGAASAVSPASAAPTASQLFSHFAPEVAEAAMNDLVVHGDLPAYLQAHRHATEEAARTGRTSDPAELHRRAVELFTDVHHETVAAHHDRAETRELDKLRQHLAADDLADALGGQDSAGGVTELGQFDPAEGHDTGAARERRAGSVRAQGYDADITASALLHDLSFGTPAVAAVDSTSPTGRSTTASKAKGPRTRAQHLSR